MEKWKIFADRGGTFTDIIAINPENKIIIHKLLSENPEKYQDPVVQGIREILDLPENSPIPSDEIQVVKMGTTVATNALLERKGEATVLVITKGFGDALRIGYQNRPDIFALNIILPEMLYQEVIKINARHDANGKELIPIDPQQVKESLQNSYDRGIRSCAIVLMHGYRYPEHEKIIGEIARDIGFTQISVSHQVSPVMKLVSRGDTTVVDAYLSPILRRYINALEQELNSTTNGEVVKLYFMQSNGGLTKSDQFQGKDSILSGPAGGIVGAVETSLQEGYNKIITFDMGGTSTDVAHFQGKYERVFQTEIAGVRIAAPMMAIHTVAAGGSSLVSFDGARYRVGPESAGANPGPACYRRGGPLTITDCNVMLGKIQPQFFPKVFGVNGDLPLDRDVVKEKLTALALEVSKATGNPVSPEEVAEGFIAIGVENMANAIKKISLSRGYDVSEYTLCCFGGAGGQHACAIAETLGMKRVLIHPYAGVLSAYGMGLADVRVIRERAVEKNLENDLLPELEKLRDILAREAMNEINPHDGKEILITSKVRLKYLGTDSTFEVVFKGNILDLKQLFEAEYTNRYGFLQLEKPLVVESVSVELIQKMDTPKGEEISNLNPRESKPIDRVKMYVNNSWIDTNIYRREDLILEEIIEGPAIIIDDTGTNIIELGWQCKLTKSNCLVFEQVLDKKFVEFIKDQNKDLIQIKEKDIECNPIKLEIFKNLFQFIAEQMGIVLENTATSINIKERLDFSCAIFDCKGDLVANAPHIPVHLGSMSESVNALIAEVRGNLKVGDIYISNNPYNGGTHLPDVTVITPVFNKKNEKIIFYLASRGHQSDIGGITPGSMPPHSKSIEEEGILIDNFKVVDKGKFRYLELRNLLSQGNFPARNPDQNIADIQAQIAANEKGLQELKNAISRYGLEMVQTYMGYVQDNAEESVRCAIDVLKDGYFSYSLDGGGAINVAIKINQKNRSATINFTGTSPQLNTNFNAPKAVCKAAVLYVFRTLVEDNIPLNAGCLKPLEIIIPNGCMLNPIYPAAVVAGNVETSQAIVDTLYGALGMMAGSQGTMNNFTFGNENYQYYETICGGAGAGAHFNGTDAIHTHMTNSRITDPEVLEWRFPILLECFKIRCNSGGNGLYKGGNGVIRKFRFLDSMTAGILSSHRNIPPFGLAGGDVGKVGHNYVEKVDGSVEELGNTATVDMNLGDIFTIETPGGGGYGIKKCHEII